jgi:solute carrier family 25 carnitine/acylcarnitine transporter 20/29
MEHKQELGHKELHHKSSQTNNAATNTEDEQEVSFLHDFIAGGVAGSASVVIGHPMDTLKVRMQTAKGNPSILTLASGSTYGGPSSLFRGMAAPLSAACVVNAIIFSSYGWSTRLYEEKYNAQHTNLKAFACGSFAGLVQALVICPMEHVKCRLQIQQAAISTSSTKTATASHPLRTTLRTILGSGNGSAPLKVAALYRGWWITCWREVPAFGAYFTLYDIFKERIQDGLDQRATEAQSEHCVMNGHGLATVTATSFDASVKSKNVIGGDENQHTSHTWIASAVAGGLTGALTWAIVYPFDVIKTQIQTAPIDTPKNERTISAVFSKIVKEHGWKHLFRGLSVTCLRAFPVNGIIFPVYEYTLLQVCDW